MHWTLKHQTTSVCGCGTFVFASVFNFTDAGMLISYSKSSMFWYVLLSGSVCPGCGTIPIQWCEHDRLQDPQYWEQPSGLHHREMVHGATAGSTQTWLWSTGRLHERESCGWNDWILSALTNPSLNLWLMLSWVFINIINMSLLDSMPHCPMLTPTDRLDQEPLHSPSAKKPCKSTLNCYISDNFSAFQTLIMKHNSVQNTLFIKGLTKHLCLTIYMCLDRYLNCCEEHFFGLTFILKDLKNVNFSLLFSYNIHLC